MNDSIVSDEQRVDEVYRIRELHVKDSIHIECEHCGTPHNEEYLVTDRFGRQVCCGRADFYSPG